MKTFITKSKTCSLRRLRKHISAIKRERGVIAILPSRHLLSIFVNIPLEFLPYVCVHQWMHTHINIYTYKNVHFLIKKKTTHWLQYFMTWYLIFFPLNLSFQTLVYHFYITCSFYGVIIYPTDYCLEILVSNFSPLIQFYTA